MPWQDLSGTRAVAAFRGYKQDAFPNNWIVEGDTLKSVPGNATDIITRDEFEDFELELEFKLTRGANSGVMHGVSEIASHTFFTGPEFQIMDESVPHEDLTADTTTGALYALKAAGPNKHVNPIGQFNHMRLVVQHGHVEHWLNGEKILDYDWDSADTRNRIAKSKFKTAVNFMKRRKGHLALQHHGGEVSYRNVRVRRL